MDMTPFIAAKSDQLNSCDLEGGPITVTITGVRGVEGDQPVAISYEGDRNKPYKPCKSMRRVMVAVWGKYANEYVGKSMTLYCDPKVQFGGMEVGGIRISHVSGITAEKKIALNTTRGKKGLYTVRPLTDAPKQQEPQQTTDDGAQKWTYGYLDRVAAAQSLEELDTFVQSKAAKLAELKDARPNLHSKALQAERDRREELSPATGSFDADDLSAPSQPQQTTGDYDGV